MLWKINRTIVPGFVGYTFVVLAFTMRCPRYQGFNLGIPSEVGSMDVVEAITRCIYPIWCKDVINIIILFFLDTWVFIQVMLVLDVVEGFCFRLLSYLMQAFYNIVEYLSYVSDQRRNVLRTHILPLFPLF